MVLAQSSSVARRWLLGLSAALWFVVVEADPVPVSVQPLRAAAIERSFDAPATVVSLNESRVGVEIGGRIETIPVRVGDEVQVGALLTRLDCTDLEITERRAAAALAALEAQHTLAQQQLDRAERLARERSASEELVDQRRAELAGLAAQVEGQQAALEAARRNVAKCAVRAPFPGIVLARLVSVGEFVDAGTPVVTLVDTQAIEVSARVPLADVDSLRSADRIFFADDRQRYRLTLRTLLPVVDPNARSREARLEFAGPRGLIGSSARLLWYGQGKYLPADLLVRRDDQLGVFILEADRARYLALPQALEGRPVAVDLPPETLLVVEGRQGLTDGEVVDAVQRP
jgi:RND family efflux transporter MFP subunit